MNNKIESIKVFEDKYLQVVEDKQLELILHPDRREKVTFLIPRSNRAIAVYLYATDTPMSSFRELAMFHIFMALVGSDATIDWKLYAIQALKYLRQMPINLIDNNLCFYHQLIAEVYKKEEQPQKAQRHQEQACLYKGKNETLTLNNLLDDMLHNNFPKSIGNCLYLLSFVARPEEGGIWGEDEFYDNWSREQYELIEHTFKQLKSLCSEENRFLIEQLSVSYLLGIYLKRTRRYVLAEAALLQALSCFQQNKNLAGHVITITLAELYTLLGEVCIHCHNKEKALEYLTKAKRTNDLKYSLLKKYINKLSVHLTPYILNFMDSEELSGLDDYSFNNIFSLFKNLCPISQKESDIIDNYFSVQENYEEEDTEETAENEEIVDENDYTFDDLYEWAEQGDVEAKGIVAECFFLGKGVTQNFRLAFKWNQLAAQQGNVIAQTNLGFMYENGYGVELNKKEAEKWYKKVKQQNDE